MDLKNTDFGKMFDELMAPVHVPPPHDYKIDKMNDIEETVDSNLSEVLSTFRDVQKGLESSSKRMFVLSLLTLLVALASLVVSLVALFVTLH